MRMAEKYNSHMLEYKEHHKAVLCRIYFSALLVTLGLATYTYFTL